MEMWPEQFIILNVLNTFIECLMDYLCKDT